METQVPLGAACPCCPDPMTKPMSLECKHTVCDKCVDVLILADMTDCPVCRKPMGVPVVNTSLADVIASLLEPANDTQHEPGSPAKRVCMAVDAGPPSPWVAHAQTVRDAAARFVSDTAQQEAQFNLAVAELHSDLDGRAGCMRADFHAASRVVLKEFDVQEASAEVYAAQWRHMSAPPEPCNLAVPALPALDAEVLKVAMANRWSPPPVFPGPDAPTAYTVHYNEVHFPAGNSTDCGQTPPLQGSAAQVARFLLSKFWRKRGRAQRILKLAEWNARTYVLPLLSGNLASMASAEYLAADDVLCVSTSAGHTPRYFTMQEVGAFLLEQDSDSEVYMRPQQHPVSMAEWCASTSNLDSSDSSEGEEAQDDE